MHIHWICYGYVTIMQRICSQYAANMRMICHQYHYAANLCSKCVTHMLQCAATVQPINSTFSTNMQLSLYAINMQWSSNQYATIMLLIWQRFAANMQPLCSQRATHIPSICDHYAQSLCYQYAQSLCYQYAINMQRICHQYPGIMQRTG